MRETSHASSWPAVPGLSRPRSNVRRRAGRSCRRAAEESAARRPTAGRTLFSWALLIAVALLGTRAVAAVDPIPDHTGMVNDFAHVMSDAEKKALEEKVNRLKQSRGFEIAVATVETTHGEPPFDYSMRMIRQWQVGDQERGGALFLVVTKDRQISVRTSTHAEGTLTDAMAGEARNAAAPFFKKGQWGAGLNAGVDKLIEKVEAAASGDPLLQKPAATPKPEAKPSASGVATGFLVLLVIILMFVGVVGFIIFVLWRLASGSGSARPRTSGAGRSDSVTDSSSRSHSSSSSYESSGSSSSYESSSSSSSDSGSSSFGGDSSSGGGADSSF